MEKFVHNFKGVVPSSCIIRIVKEEKTLVLFENTGDGTSVTNATEILATEILEKLNIDPDNCRFFETYENHERIDEIQYTWTFIKVKGKKNRWEACSPEWIPMEKRIKKTFELK